MRFLSRNSCCLPRVNNSCCYWVVVFVFCIKNNSVNHVWVVTLQLRTTDVCFFFCMIWFFQPTISLYSHICVSTGRTLVVFGGLHHSLPFSFFFLNRTDIIIESVSCLTPEFKTDPSLLFISRFISSLLPKHFHLESMTVSFFFPLYFYQNHPVFFSDSSVISQSRFLRPWIRFSSKVSDGSMFGWCQQLEL